MEHLAMRREVEERKKISHISQGLSAFVEGRSRLASNTIFSQGKELHRPTKDTRDQSMASTPNVGDTDRSISEMVHEPKEIVSRPHQSSDDESGSDQNLVSQDGSGSITPNHSFEQAYMHTLSRAANLLRESLNLHNGGGVVFLDATMGFSSKYSDSARDHDRQHAIDSAMYSVDNSSEATDIPADVLAQSLAPAYQESGHQAQCNSKFCPMPQSALQKIMKRYPRGKLWVFDEDLSLSSSEEDQFNEQIDLNMSNGLRRPQRKSKQVEARVLQDCFPGGQYGPLPSLLLN